MSAKELMLLNCGLGRRLWRVPWTARRSNQSILKEISPEYSLEGLMVKLKHQYFGHLMRRADSLEKTLILGKTESRVKRMRMRWLDGITDLMDLSWANSERWWRTEKTGMLQPMGSQRLRHDWATEQQQSMLSWIRAPKRYSWCLFQLWFLFPLWTDFL